MRVYIKIRKTEVTQELLEQSLCSDITQYPVTKDGDVILKFNNTIPSGYEDKEWHVTDPIVWGLI